MVLNKEVIRTQIIAQLEHDQALLLKASKDAHNAATDSESIAEDKYDTRGLEASYIAQGQANRAQDIRGALNQFSSLQLKNFRENEAIRLTALVELEAGDGRRRLVFLGPSAGGLQILADGQTVMVITPASPLGRELLGKKCGDSFIVQGGAVTEYEILSIC